MRTLGGGAFFFVVWAAAATFFIVGLDTREEIRMDDTLEGGSFWVEGPASAFLGAGRLDLDVVEEMLALSATVNKVGREQSAGRMRNTGCKP